MQYKSYLLFNDGLRLDLNRKSYDRRNTEDYTHCKINEIKNEDVQILISGEATKDKWRNLYNNWWMHRFLRFFGIKLTL
jgi:hypothetical protein